MAKFRAALFFFLCFYTLQGQKSIPDSEEFQQLFDSLKSSPITDSTYALAETLHEYAVQHFPDKHEEITIKGWLGLRYSHRGKHKAALNLLQAAMTKAEALGDAELIAKNNLSLGTVYTNLNENQKAISYIEQAIQGFQKIGEEKLLAKARNNLGVVYWKLQDLEKALAQFLPAKDFLEKQGDSRDIDDINNIKACIAVAYVQLGKPQKGFPYFTELLAYYKTNKDTFRFAESYGNLAYAYQHIQDYEKAFIHYDSSLYYSRLLNRDEITYITLLDMSDGYNMKGDYKNALKYYREYHQLAKKVVGEKTKKNISELEVKYETEKKERALLEGQKEIQSLEEQAQIRRQRMGLIFVSLLASLLLALLLYIKWRSDSKNKAIQQRLMQSELKNKELETTLLKDKLAHKQADLTNFALDIGRKNKFSNQLVEKLEQLEKVKPDKVRPQLREVIHFAISHLQINEDLALLQENVDKINQEFYQKLDASFGGLSTHEKYLAGLIRLNLSNKDVAVIKGISTNSAKMNRYRLRKKLSLEPTEDIVQFLQNL